MRQLAATACPVQRQRGYSLIEILIALLVALFLLAGLGSMVAGTRKTSTNQTSLAQLQDEERLAMSMINDVLQTAGYFDANPSDTATYTSATAAFPAITTTGGPSNPVLVAGQALGGTHSTTTPDTLVVQYRTNGSDNVIACDGTTSTGAATYTNFFFITTTTPYQLQCSKDGNASDAVTLISNVVNLQIWYGVSTTGTSSVDTYVQANNVANWANVISARVTLTFNNPLYYQPGGTVVVPGQPQYVTFTRVITLQSRAGYVQVAT